MATWTEPHIVACMSLTLDEARARAGQLSDISYDVALDLTDPGSGWFGSRTTVRFRSSVAETFLELASATELGVRVNGTDIDPAYDADRIALTGLAEENEVVVEARLPYVTDGAGMHSMTDPADGATYVGAYLGMDLARLVFACFDQPDLKATIAIAVTADPAWTVISNGRQVERSGGTWRFATTPPISPNLVVVCAGPWHSVTWEHRGLPFGWHARRSLAAELDRDADDLRTATEACFDHYTAMFDEPYPFDSYDQALVPGLNWGAQEMPGCVTYRDEMLPRGELTETVRTIRTMVIAHEMAHMWFGDLVTMRWWEDSWLNESFADYMGFRVAADAVGVAGAQALFEARQKPEGYDADRRRSTHPVAARTEDVGDVESAYELFDAISYAKGNSVVRQLVTWLGDEEFLAGVNTYFGRHRFANASLADFVDALASASSRDVRGWAEAWLRTTGHDTIAVERDGDVPVLVRHGSRPHRFRVTAYDAELREVGSRMVDLDADPVRLDDWAGRVVVPNSQGETFAALRLDPDSWTAVTGGLARVDDGLTRAVLWGAALDLVHHRELTADGFLDLVRAQLPTETDPGVAAAVIAGTLRGVIPRRVPLHAAPAAVDTLADACSAGLAAGASAGVAPVLADGLAATSRDVARLRRWLDDGRSEDGAVLTPTRRWTVVHRLAELGAVDQLAIEAERRRDPGAEGDLGAATALAALPDQAAKDAAWEAMLGPDVSNRRFEALARGLWSAEQPDLVAPYIARYLTEAPRLAQRRGPTVAQAVGKAFPTTPLTHEQVALLDTALAGDLPVVLRRSWEDHRDDLG